MKILVTEKAFIEVYEDDYEQGEGDFVDQWDSNLSETTFDSYQELLDSIYEDTGYMFEAKPEYFSFDTENSKLYTSALVNNDNGAPSEEERKLWMDGEEILYAANFSLRLHVIDDEREMTEDDAKIFGISNIE